jgi:hypothetical protein
MNITKNKFRKLIKRIINEEVENKNLYNDAMKMAQECLEFGFEVIDHDWDIEDRTASIIIKPDNENYQENDMPSLEFNMYLNITRIGYYDPGRFWGHPDSWYPPEAEDDEYEYILTNVIYYIDNEKKILIEDIIPNDYFTKLFNERYDEFFDYFEQYMNKLNTRNNWFK